MQASEDSSSRPLPSIGKMGPYTVFITPPTAPNDSNAAARVQSQKAAPPRVQPPPPQFEKLNPKSDASKLGFFWNTVTKVQNAHSSLDEHVARWLGLDQSKYQWALDDYYGSKGLVQEDGKVKETLSKTQNV